MPLIQNTIKRGADVLDEGGMYQNCYTFGIILSLCSRFDTTTSPQSTGGSLW